MPIARWRVYAYSTASVSTTPTACATGGNPVGIYQRLLNTAASMGNGRLFCLALGGGLKSDGTPLTAIQINNINTTAHIVSSAAGNCIDMCGTATGHIWAISVAVSTPTSCYQCTSAAFAMSKTAPFRMKGLHYKFDYVTQNTQVTQTQIWSGNGPTLANGPAGGSIYIAELATGAPTWTASYTGSRKSLTKNGVNNADTLSTDVHEWYIAISCVATAVGLSTATRVRIENTFQ